MSRDARDGFSPHPSVGTELASARHSYGEVHSGFGNDDVRVLNRKFIIVSSQRVAQYFETDRHLYGTPRNLPYFILDARYGVAMSVQCSTFVLCNPFLSSRESLSQHN